MRYVDGFILLIPKKNFAAYKKMAAGGRDLWMKHGALDYVEAVMDDAKPAHVSWTFAKMTGAKPSEVIVFSYITYKSRAHRNAVNKKLMKDPAMQEGSMDDMPFDMKRMSMAGFQAFVETKKKK